MMTFFSPKKKPVKMIQDSASENECTDEKSEMMDMKKMYELKSMTNKQSRKFRTESHLLHASFKNFEELPPHQLEPLFDDVTKQINSMLHTEPSDKIRMTINHPALDMGIHIPFTDAAQLTGSIILNEIEKVLQSNADFRMNDGNMTFDVTHTHPPQGCGRMSKSTIDSAVFAKKKTSLVQINNTKDSMCFARAVVVGMCHVNREPTEEWKKRWGLIRNPDRNLQKTEAENLLEETGISPSTPCGQDEYNIIQTYLYAKDYVIKVHQQHSSVEMVYLHPGVENIKTKVIHLYFHQNHYDYITNIRGFLGCGYYCEFCDVAYQNRESHLCPNKCKGCFGNVKCMSSGNSYECNQCHRIFFNRSCFDNHKSVYGKQQKSICQLVKNCRKCGKQFQSRKGKHICAGKKKCRFCKQITTLDHRCHIQPYESKTEQYVDGEEKIKKPLFIFFDFECKQDTGVHIPNYCIAHRACDICIDKPVDFHCTTCSEFGEGREVIFQGNNTLHEFCTWLFADCHKSMTAIAHNFKAYDGQFILKNIIQQGTKLPKLIMNGNNIMKLELNGVCLIDSYNFMSFGLAKFPVTFGLDELRKGFFPHLANTDDFQDYIGPFLDSSYYIPNSMSPEARSNFMQWYNEQVTNGKIFDFKKEMEEYCRSDVDILRRGCGQFRKVFIKHGGIDPFLEAITIADACNKVWRSSYLAEGQIAIISSKDSSKRRFSIKGIRWIQSVANENNIFIQHAKNGGEYEIGPYSVDGFHKESNTVYEFHGDLYHGCPVCYPNRLQTNPFNGETMQSLFEKTMNRIAYIKQKGYNVHVMWEHEFDAKLKDKEYKKYIESIFPHCDPIDPREGLYGGRCNAIELSHDIDLKDEKEIKYIDICSPICM